ncbi:AI-2E family transporter [Haploplasma axanthum]|nr:AI-2E family transporter [Haploplasma axanthum]
MKKFLGIMLCIISVLAFLYLFHLLNATFPNNIISRILKGFSLVITPVLFALVLMYLVNPLARKLMRQKGISKKGAIIITMTILFAVIAALVFFIVSFLIDKGVDLYNQITSESFIHSVQTWFSNNNLYKVYEWIEELITSLDIKDFIGNTNSIITTVLQTISVIILVPIFLWHFLNAQEVVVDKINENIPTKWQKNIIPIIEDSNQVIVSYFKSKMISIVMLFSIFVFVYALLGLPIGYVILFAFLIAILDLVPYIGPAIGMIIPIIYVFSVNGTNLLYNPNWHVNGLIANIILFSLNASIQFLQDNIIMPKLAGKEMNINSAMILVFMLFFGYILGVWGIILSIPLGGIILVVWKHLKESEFFSSKKKTRTKKQVTLDK